MLLTFKLPLLISPTLGMNLQTQWTFLTKKLNTKIYDSHFKNDSPPLQTYPLRGLISKNYEIKFLYFIRIKYKKLWFNFKNYWPPILTSTTYLSPLGDEDIELARFFCVNFQFLASVISTRCWWINRSGMYFYRSV